MSIFAEPLREALSPVGAGRRDATARRQELMAQLAARARRPGPLARQQARLFALWQLDRESSAYHESVVLRLQGRLDREALLAAVRSLPQRHEWLRSHIEVRGAEAVQVLDAEPALDVRVTSRPGPADGPRGRLPAAIKSWVETFTRDPFDLEHGPVWRAGLASLGPQDNVLVLVVHHVACDATALGVLLDEVEERYTAACSGGDATLPPVASPRDVAARLLALQDGDTLDAAVRGHVDQLVGADYTAPLVQQRHGPGPAAVVSRRVPTELAARVRRVADELGVSAFAVVTTAVAAGTSRSLGTNDLVVGVPVDLRWQLPSGKDVVAFLVETLALRLRGISARSLEELAADVADATASALDRPLPFDAVVDELRARGELPPTGTPLHVYVNWLDGGETSHLGAGGPSVTHVDEPLHDAKFDLSWTAVSRGSELTLRLEHDSSRWDRPAAERLLDRAVHVLDVATAAASTPLGQLGLLLPDEAERISTWEGTAGADPAVDLLTFVLDGLADGPTSVLEGTGFTGVRRDMLVAGIDRLAAALLAAGVRPEDRVAVSGRRGPGMIMAVLAVLRAGAAFVPLDERQPRARQVELAGRAGVRAVLGPGEWAGPLAAALGVGVVDVDQPATQGSGPPVWRVRQPDSTAYVLHTSGSTGVPKGVRVSDAAVVARALSYRKLLTAEPARYLLQSTLGFDASIYLFWVLASGGCLVLPTDGDSVDPGRLAEMVQRYRVTDCFFVPTFYAALLDAAPRTALDSLLRVCVGGEVMPPALAARHAGVLPSTDLLNVYGPTEAVTTSTAHTLVATDAESAAVPIGRPHQGTQARVLDDAGHPVAVGAPGELHLGGPCVASGYDGMPGLSGPFSIRPDHHGRPVRWYATGDVVRWLEDGQLDFLGRRDRQVKVRGQRIELAEVEAAILRVPGVIAAAVHVLTDAGSARLGAVVAPTAVGVRDAVAAHLPAAWVPERLVAVPTMPQHASGKVDRAAVGRLLQAQMWRHDGPGSRSAVPSEPRTAVKAGVLSVVRDLLGNQEIGMDDDFFAAGGNSLLAARLIGALHELLGATVQMHELAVGATPRHIAATLAPALTRLHVARPRATVVTLRGSGSKAPLVIVAREGDASFFLRRVLQDLDPDRPVHMLLRSMPAPGFRVPDLVESGREAAGVLREHFPRGPVHLLGHSASGIVALEAARRLGEPHGTTTLLDTTLPSGWSRRPYRWVAVPVLTVRRQLGLLRRGQHPSQGGLEAAESLRLLRYYQEEMANSFARIRPVHFPVTLVAVAESCTRTGRSDLGWSRHCSALTVVHTSAEHITMLLKPHVEQTLDVLRQALATAP